MSSSVQRWLRAKQGPACLGWILEPETPTLLLHLGGSLPDQLCLTWSTSMVPTFHPPVSCVRLGMSAQAMQRLGHWCPSATPGTQLRRARVSYLWCDHPGGRPCPAGAIYCLIYLLRLLPPNSHLLQAPGVYTGQSRVAVQPTEPILLPAPGVGPQPTSLWEEELVQWLI